MQFIAFWEQTSYVFSRFDMQEAKIHFEAWVLFGLFMYQANPIGTGLHNELFFISKEVLVQF